MIVLESQNYYDVLKVDHLASQKDIKKSYFKLIRKYSPEKDQEEFMKIRNAYEILSNEESRKEFDEFIRVQGKLMKAYDESRYYEQRGSFSHAIKILETYKDEIIDIRFIQSYLAELCMDNGNTQKAIKILERLVEKEPLHAGFSARLADAYACRGWSVKAIDEYQRAITLDGDNISVWLGYIKTCYESDRYELAQAASQRARDLSEQNGWDSMELLCLQLMMNVERRNHTVIEKISKEIVDKFNKSEDIEMIKMHAPILGIASNALLMNGKEKVAFEVMSYVAKKIPEDENIVEFKKFVEKIYKQLELVNELKATGKISGMLKDIIETRIKIDRYELDVFSIKARNMIYREIYYMIDSEKAIKEVKYLKANHRDLFDIVGDYSGVILATDFKTQFIYFVNEKLIQEGEEKAFLDFVKINRLDSQKANEILDKTKQKFRGIFLCQDPEKPYIAEKKVGRNDPCICGSGKKYKKCCSI